MFWPEQRVAAQQRERYRESPFNGFLSAVFNQWRNIAPKTSALSVAFAKETRLAIY
jgi:hypothetical protein